MKPKPPRSWFATLSHQASSMTPYWHRQTQLAQQFLTLQSPQSRWLSSPIPNFESCSTTQFCRRLNHRIDEDRTSEPIRSYGLWRWCQHEGVSMQTMLERLNCSDFTRVHRFHAQFLDPHQKAALATVDAMSWAQMAITPYTAQDALALILAFWESTDTASATWLKQLIDRQRLIISNADTDAAWCLDTPFGAYVYLDYQPDLHHLMTLIHELGHARHQDWHRQSSSRPLRVIEKETAALSAEQTLLNWLEHQPEPFPCAVRAYRIYLNIEMTARQWMLSQFEYDLYQLDAITPEGITVLWCQHLQNYCGPQVELESNDLQAWRTLPQLITAPFYRLSYPLAYARVFNA